MKHLLVIRNSAMGDVALALPAVKAALDTYPDLRITFVSNKDYRDFFAGTDRLTFFPTDFKSTYKGLSGLFKLFSDLRRAGPFDAVLDLHAVIRSWLIAAYFSARGLKVFRIDKGRQDKKAITRKENKLFKPLKPAHERYSDVFKQAGYPITLGRGPWLTGLKFPVKFFKEKSIWPKKKSWIGLAPFARHLGKRWPVNKSEQLIKALSEAGHQVFLFGGGKQETAQLDYFALKYDQVYSLAGKFTLERELAVMGKMDVMVTMDSSNLHMAALVGTPVVSIWGSTHSFAGFEPLGENKSRKVEIDPSVLPCRPCSVFGNVPCYRGDYACLNWIKVEEVRRKIDEVLENFRV